ncbi:hypothetical protein [Ferrimonas sp.]|uniref:hypothetical protein n=1 Tax=Ferrimonas sp. TaxID=2080861 RepID=UPI003A8E3053
MIKLYSYYFETLLFKFSFGPEQGADTPAWAEEAPFPPLAPRAAIAASSEALAEMLADYPCAEPSFDACALKRSGPNGWWYYHVSWMVWPPECDGGDRSEIHLPVMLNGQVPPYQVFDFENRFEAWSD